MKKEKKNSNGHSRGRRKKKKRRSEELVETREHGLLHMNFEVEGCSQKKKRVCEGEVEKKKGKEKHVAKKKKKMNRFYMSSSQLIFPFQCFLLKTLFIKKKKK